MRATCQHQPNPSQALNKWGLSPGAPPTTRLLPAKPGLGWIMEGNKKHKDQKNHQGPPDGLSLQDRKPRGPFGSGMLSRAGRLR